VASRAAADGTQQHLTIAKCWGGILERGPTKPWGLADRIPQNFLESGRARPRSVALPVFLGDWALPALLLRAPQVFDRISAPPHLHCCGWGASVHFAARCLRRHPGASEGCGRPTRGVAQPGRALRSGRRCRRFKSCHPDHMFLHPAPCSSAAGCIPYSAHSEPSSPGMSMISPSMSRRIVRALAAASGSPPTPRSICSR
jgi:hypothetical protein